MEGPVQEQQDLQPQDPPGRQPSRRPDDRRAAAVPRGRRWWIAGLAIAAATVVVIAPLASSDPDGLERVAEDQGFGDRAEDAWWTILPDYTIPGLDDPRLATIVSGLVGVALVFGAMWLLGRLIARRRA